MFKPSASNSEFIEIFNLSFSDTVDLTGYGIKYHTSAIDHLDSSNINFKLPPRKFAVIFEGDYDTINGIYSNLIPSDAIILKIDNNAFGSSGMSNSSDRKLYLIDSTGVIVDSIIYTANNSSGISDEKIEMTSLNDSDNWSNSLVINGTPGFKNSVSPFEYDAQFSSITISPAIPFAYSNSTINGIIKNVGLKTISSIQVRIFDDINLDSIIINEDYIYSALIDSIPTGDSAFFEFNYSFNLSGSHQIIGVIELAEDLNPSNNKFFFQFYVAPKPNKYGDILINEFMYLPEGDEPEWIEFYNNTSEPINLKKWKIRDKSSQINVTNDTLIIEANDYLVIAEDSLTNFYSTPINFYVKNIPSLNNSGDEIVLVDSLGTTIDSVNYSALWGNKKGISLERIMFDAASFDSTNWKNSLATEGATPGYYNSISPHNYDLWLKDFTINTAYAVQDETFEAFCLVKNSGIRTSDNFELRIYYDFNKDSLATEDEIINSKLITGLTSGDSTLESFSITNLPLGKGILTAAVFFPPDEFTDNNFIKEEINVVKLNVFNKDVVINEIMYAPQSPEPEWIELYNRTEREIDLSRFIIADSKDSTQIDTSYVTISPSGYAIIAKEKSITSIYNLSGLIIYSDFPLLNNSTDEIVLMDSLGRVIDSVKYYSDWGGSGKSLERIDADGSSTDSLNWKESRDERNATPLMINSVSQKLFDIAIDTAILSPSIPFIGDNINCTIRINNLGKLPVEFYVNIFENVLNDSLANELIFTSQTISIEPETSINIEANNLINNIHDKHYLIIEAVSSNDQDATNNTFQISITPSYSANKIIINEFMIYPENGEPEWIELQNISSDTIDINGWTISDVITTPKSVIITDSNLTIFPGDYLVISKDSTIFEYHRTIPAKLIKCNFANMNNDEDGIVIRDANGKTIDSLYYNSNWEITKGYSEEKINRLKAGNDTDNWDVSIDIEQSTPGRINSIAEKQRDVLISRIETIPQFPASGDSVNIAITIKNKGLSYIDNVNLKIYRDSLSTQLLIEEININRIAAMDSLIVITSSKIEIIDSIKLVGIVSSPQDKDTFNNYFKTVKYSGLISGMIAINELMISPKDNEPEWIEFVNSSGTTINLKGLTITDLFPSPKETVITNNDFYISPGAYFIVSADSLKTDAPLFINNFGTFSSKEDAIKLSDFRGSVIDSFHYNSGFFIKEGRSIERYDIYSNTNDIMNWYPSVDSNGSTIGNINSITKLKPIEHSALKFNEIMYEPLSGRSEFIEFINTSSENYNLAGCAIIKNDSVRIELSPLNIYLHPNDFFIISNDSSIIANYDLSSKTKFININKFNLSNGGEPLVLIDFFNNSIDSVNYSPNWHSKNTVNRKGKSLERINPEHDSNENDNWGTSVAAGGATPLSVNSIFTASQNTSTSMSFSNNPFSPDGDGFEDFTIISYSLKSATAQIRLRVFDDKGRLVRTIADYKPSGSKGKIIFDGLNDKGEPLRVGMYIVLLEAVSESGNILEVQKKVLVIATKL